MGIMNFKAHLLNRFISLSWEFKWG